MSNSDINRQLCRSCLDLGECRLKGKDYKKRDANTLAYCTNRTERGK